jgi:hypothetical protein
LAIPDSRLASGSQNRLLSSEGAIWKARIVSQLSQTGIVESAPISVLRLDGKPVAMQSSIVIYLFQNWAPAMNSVEAPKPVR